MIVKVFRAVTRSDNDDSAARNSTNDPQTFQSVAIEGVSREIPTYFSPRYPVASDNASSICIPDTYAVGGIVQYERYIKDSAQISRWIN